MLLNSFKWTMWSHRAFLWQETRKAPKGLPPFATVPLKILKTDLKSNQVGEICFYLQQKTQELIKHKKNKLT